MEGIIILKDGVRERGFKNLFHAFIYLNNPKFNRIVEESSDFLWQRTIAKKLKDLVESRVSTFKYLQQPLHNQNCYTCEETEKCD